jgi:hypothetical protein
LEPLAAHILLILSSENCLAEFKHYKHLVVASGGASKVLSDMMEATDTQFRGLQGKMVTLEA